MALTNSGFDGTVTEAACAQMSALTDVDAVESAAAWAVTQGTGRQVSTAAHSGFAFAKGVLSKDTAAILTNLSTPVNGQWFLIVRHIDWATNGVTVTAVAHDVTTTTVPTVAPTTFPTIDNNPGVLYDQKLAWAWVRSTDTTVTLFDLRIMPPTATNPAPFAMAAGLTTLPGNGTATAEATVTLPVGRFSVPPIVVTSSRADSVSVYLIASADSVTASSFTLRIVRPGSTFNGDYDISWTATQMASGSAAG